MKRRIFISFLSLSFILFSFTACFSNDDDMSSSDVSDTPSAVTTPSPTAKPESSQDPIISDDEDAISDMPEDDSSITSNNE